jgi:Na+-transporting methylmalonyl-CoA/oxaloacetate decarboxylase gamma subunit
LIEAFPFAAVPLAVDWAEAGRVSATGIAGVFLVLTLLYLTTLLYGRIARWTGWSSHGAKDDKN